MNITDHIKTIRDRGFIRVNIPGEDDQFEIRADLLADDTPAITLDAVEILVAADVAGLLRRLDCLRDMVDTARALGIAAVTVDAVADALEDR